MWDELRTQEMDVWTDEGTDGLTDGEDVANIRRLQKNGRYSRKATLENI